MKSTKLGNALDVRELKEAWGDELKLELVSGAGGLSRQIRLNRVQKPGLRMIDPEIELESDKIQIFGRTEISYFEKLFPEEQRKAADTLSSQDVPCFIISKGLTPPQLFEVACEKMGMPLFKTELYTGRLISLLNSKLEERLSPVVTAHGVLMDIHRLGVLILGKSGIGKSECALDLILRGSKLIADDLVEIRKVGTSRLLGSGPENIKYHMEIRGIGIINIKDLFGTTSVMDRREIDMVIELSKWDPDTEYDRLGLEEESYNILDVELPYIVIPVSPGRNVATIIEVAVRNELLKLSGTYTAEEFRHRIDKDIEEKESL